MTLVTLMTAPTPGAVGLIQWQGHDIQSHLARLTGRRDWPLGRLFLVDFKGIDQGLAVRLRDDWAQLMPHGGPRVLHDLCKQLDGQASRTIHNQTRYPEAASELEADMLAALAVAPSPRAIDALLAQGQYWDTLHLDSAPAILQRREVCNQLITPPTVVIAGPANVGKSTLTNRMLGYAASLVADLPGTTRDWVGGLAELDDVAVHWLDTPGIRHSKDPIEQQAIAMAATTIERANVLIVMRDPQTDWLTAKELGREPHLRVYNKMDCQTTDEPGVLSISAQQDIGIEPLVKAVLKQLGLDQPFEGEPWAFSDRLYDLVQQKNERAFQKYTQKG